MAFLNVLDNTVVIVIDVLCLKMNYTRYLTVNAGADFLAIGCHNKLMTFTPHLSEILDFNALRNSLTRVKRRISTRY